VVSETLATKFWQLTADPYFRTGPTVRPNAPPAICRHTLLRAGRRVGCRIYGGNSRPTAISAWHRRGQERAVLITLAVVLDQVREILFEERKKNRCRTWFEEVGWRRRGALRLRQPLALKPQDPRRIGDAGQDGRTTHAHIDSGLAERAQRFETQIRTRRARLQNPRQVRV